jgi:GNAT superfamily N-acetyltransferase
VEALDRDLPAWSSAVYPRRLQQQRRLQMVQVVAWRDAVPLGRGMVLFPEHEEYSESAARERVAEVRDVFVRDDARRIGAASAMMRALEDEARTAGFPRVGLAVSLDEEAAAARALYERLGYRHAHGPFVTSATLEGEDGDRVVGAVLTYLVKGP